MIRAMNALIPEHKVRRPVLVLVPIRRGNVRRGGCEPVVIELGDMFRGEGVLADQGLLAHALRDKPVCVQVSVELTRTASDTYIS